MRPPDQDRRRTAPPNHRRLLRQETGASAAHWLHPEEFLMIPTQPEQPAASSRSAAAERNAAPERDADTEAARYRFFLLSTLYLSAPLHSLSVWILRKPAASAQRKLYRPSFSAHSIPASFRQICATRIPPPAPAFFPRMPHALQNHDCR